MPVELMVLCPFLYNQSANKIAEQIGQLLPIEGAAVVSWLLLPEGIDTDNEESR